MVAVGESIGDCTLVRISLEDESIRLRPKNGAEFTIKRDSAGR
jgi:hypothetical protein